MAARRAALAVARPAGTREMLDPDMRFADVSGHVIVLDLARDRYRRLGCEVSEIVRVSRQRRLTADERARLATAGLLATHGGGRSFLPIQLPVAPREALIAPDAPQEKSRGALLALAGARVWLATRGLAAAIRSAERAARSMTKIDDDRAARLARGFERARQAFPLERRCLPDGLALHRLLAAERLAATLVIGVRDAPFAAHCWVQAGPWLLTDTSDMIAELTPILAI